MIQKHLWKKLFKKKRDLLNFFQQAKGIIRNFDIKENQQKWTIEDYKLNHKLRETKEKVHHHICNNIDTPSIISELSSLLSDTNRYMKSTSTQIKSPLIVSVSKYLFKILKLLGVVTEEEFKYTSASEDSEILVAPYVQVVVDFRDQVKQLAGKDKALIINECDKVRDVSLAKLGIKLEDTGMTTPSNWVKVDSEDQLKSTEDKEKSNEDVFEENEEKKNNIHPKDYFKTFKLDQYSQFDENGVPTHNAMGVPLSTEKINELEKKMTSMIKKWNNNCKKNEDKIDEENKE